MVLGIQIVGMLFGVFILYMTFVMYKRKEFTFNEWGFWTLFAIIFALISIFPRIIDPVVISLNLGRKMDLLVIVGFMFLTAAALYTYMVARRNQKRIENLVRNLALKKKK
jgi:hypothetical protein